MKQKTKVFFTLDQWFEAPFFLTDKELVEARSVFKNDHMTEIRAPFGMEPGKLLPAHRGCIGKNVLVVFRWDEKRWCGHWFMMRFC